MCVCIYINFMLERILYYYNSFPEIIVSLFQATVHDFDLIHSILELELELEAALMGHDQKSKLQSV